MMREKTQAITQNQYHIVIIGSGPRGLSVLERLAARILANGANGIRQFIDIYLIDAVQLGCGGIWRTNQPDWFLMNTVADEVSAFSGPADCGPARPGAGPSLAQWWESIDADFPGPNHYAPRSLHGRYMLFVLATIEAALANSIKLHKINSEVIDIDTANEMPTLTLSNGLVFQADRIIFTTGHIKPALAGSSKQLMEFSNERPKLRYIAGDSAADMPLDQITPNSPVGIIGLGLSFYDVMAALTIGRGGRYIRNDHAILQYIPSGREPLLFAGSRSGLPIPARGKNQKDPNFRYEPAVFTWARVNALRQRSPIDFKTSGVNVTQAPFHPINRYQQADPRLYVLGIPSEYTRWFMHAGSSRPGFWTDFFIDADAIAKDALKPVYASQPEIKPQPQAA